MKLNVKHILLHMSNTASGNLLSLTSTYKAKGFPIQPYARIYLNGRASGSSYDSMSDGIVVPGKELTVDNFFISDAEYAMHAKLNGGYKNAIACCLIGAAFSDFTSKQILSAVRDLRSLLARFGLDESAIIGHYEASNGTKYSCPNLDMDGFRKVVAGGVSMTSVMKVVNLLNPE